MTSSLARAGKALVALLTLGSLVLLSGCVPFRDHPPEPAELWEDLVDESDVVVASRHYGPGWGRIDGEDVIVFGYREGFDRSGGLPGAYGGSVYVVRADGTKLKRLSPSIGDGRGLGGEKAAYDISPDVSPDGRWLAYATHRNSNRLQIVTFELDGRGQGRIVRGGSHLGVPAWAPDGKALAFNGTWTDRHNVIIAEPDGSNRRFIAPDIIPAHERPSWSPDGNLLAFRSHPGRDTTVAGISDGTGYETFGVLYIAAVDGSSVVEVPGTATTRPVWSPDGRHIAVGGSLVETGGPPQWGIYVLDADGGNPRVIDWWDYPRGAHDLLSLPLLWSPDGAELWVGRGNIEAISVATQERRTIVVPSRFQGIAGMAWSPDGSRLAVVTQPAGPGRAIGYKDGVFVYEVVPVLYTVAADGSDIRVLVQLEDPTDGEEGDVELKGVPQ